MDVAEFDYELPAERIAQVPVEPRDGARLLVDRGKDLPPEHRVVRDLPELVGPGDVVVVNTTRVLPARLHLRKATGGAVEVFLLERQADGRWHALVKPGRKVAPGTRLAAGDDLVVEVGERAGADGVRWVVLHTTAADDLDALARYGAVPLPPYITAPLADPERYQTVFADRPES
ncbi:MAG TPA: S-adenosylmethionine:tRNA ribosyltransferase-isomerase, partial [Acidimicrobiales bacterium]